MAGTTLLIVDDEPNILTTLRRALEIEGYLVEVAGAGRIALAKLEDREVDLVLLDVMMPEMDGLSTLRQIRERNSDLPVIMMSGHGSVDTAVQATKLGAYDFLEKPLSTEKTLVTVKNALAHARLAREHAQLAARARAELAMIGQSPRMRAIHDLIRKTAPTSGRVLITGENGTGKELVARAVHENSKRADKAFIKLNCAAIPQELIESELFGHEKGAFTGATQKRRGKFELADGGTLFLDEVGDMNPSAQAKVLRVLQEGELERVGGHETIKVDVRVVAATNKNLEEEIKVVRFREDLFYRLNVVPIRVPPLRDHREDIPDLASHFVQVLCATNDRKKKYLTPNAVTLLIQYEWPGNVRELRNSIERLVILTGDAPEITEADVQEILPSVKRMKIRHGRGGSLKDRVAAAEREIVLHALEECQHHIANTARELGLERSHLYKKMRALGIPLRGGREAGLEPNDDGLEDEDE
ncbi:MAG: sigma-54-dependent Fis family transcriptional regulator [Deltaproteobacteria bacterium]|nr:sigma-54-dependent Fis family transcriptional regulator [Deltaproteobacteria bacterium]